MTTCSWRKHLFINVVYTTAVRSLYFSARATALDKVKRLAKSYLRQHCSWGSCVSWSPPLYNLEKQCFYQNNVTSFSLTTDFQEQPVPTTALLLSLLKGMCEPLCLLPSPYQSPSSICPNCSSTFWAFNVIRLTRMARCPGSTPHICIVKTIPIIYIKKYLRFSYNISIGNFLSQLSSGCMGKKSLERNKKHNHTLYRVAKTFRLTQYFSTTLCLPGGSGAKNPPAMSEMKVHSRLGKTH